MEIWCHRPEDHITDEEEMRLRENLMLNQKENNRYNTPAQWSPPLHGKARIRSEEHIPVCKRNRRRRRRREIYSKSYFTHHLEQDLRIIAFITGAGGGVKIPAKICVGAPTKINYRHSYFGRGCS